MKIDFIATHKNIDRSERELYEMDLVLRVLGMKRAFLDLGLVTVAACTPKGHSVRLVDEYLTDINYDTDADLIALSAKTSCVTRAYQVADEFRRRGKRVVLGGIHASLRPEEALQHVDCVVKDEAEAIWPLVVQDAANGKLKERYDANGFPPMEHIPVPAWDAGPYNDYLFHQIQTTRGCPFRCRFCSVPDISGQEFRFKPVENVVREMHALPRGGGLVANGRPLYVVDDNFISRSRYTKELLQALVPLYEAGVIPPWSAETTLNVAMDPEMLDLFCDAGCATLIIGFESVTEATLNDMDKPVNFCLSYEDAVHEIHSRGMTIVGNFIVGFDTDTRSVFKDTLDFVQNTGILYPFFSILTPMPGTQLHQDYRDAGRLDHTDWHLYDTRHVVMEPKHMRRDELMDGYVWLYEQAYSTDKLLARLERHWKQRRGRRNKWIERQLLKWKLKPELRHDDAGVRHLYRGGLDLLANKHLNGDAGQLLFVLDADDFARSMRRDRTERWEENYRTFENPDAASANDEEVALRLRQWETVRAQRASERHQAKLTRLGAS